MRWRPLGFVFLMSLLALSPNVVSAEENWKELRGDHFIIYYLNDDKFAADVLQKAEGYYKNIASDLGYQRYSDFWQWENRVKIYLYTTQEEFLKATGRQDWSHGMADYTAKEIRSYMWKEGFVESLLPHEITHLVFRDYVGFKGEIPLWLDEGVAEWEEPHKRAIARESMKVFLAEERKFSLRDLTQIDIRNVKIELAVKLFYVQSVSVIDFMISQHGADDFITFCRQLRDGKTLDEALKFSYSGSIRDLNELEEQWNQYVSKSV